MGGEGDMQGGNKIGRQLSGQVGKEGYRQGRLKVWKGKSREWEGWEREGREVKGKIARETGRLRENDKNRDQGTTKGAGKVWEGKRKVGNQKENVTGMKGKI